MGKVSKIATDTCNPDRLLSSKLATHVAELSKERSIADGEYAFEVLLQKIDYHNYLRGFWIG